MELRDALRLIFIVDGETARDGDRVDGALGGGVTALWLRDADLSGADLYRRARDLAERCRAHHAALVIGDRADVALAVGAAGVQLGHRSPPARRVRPFFPGWLGVSCHSAGDLERAAGIPADFAVLSPVYGVPEKGPPLGAARFATLVERAGTLPVVGLGGIDGSNAQAVRDAGAAGVAVIRALRDAGDAAAEARRLAG